MSTPSNMPAEETLTFEFEDEFVDDLRCIPMVVRYKLDTCGIKLKLAQWNQFSEDEREQFVFQPCDSEDEIDDYREFLTDLVFMYAETEAAELPVEENPSWLNVSAIPTSLAEKVQACDTSISLKQWKALSPLQRFALIKLSQPGHESKNFLPALKEFQLI